jgi:hypothetical protein
MPRHPLAEWDQGAMGLSRDRLWRSLGDNDEEEADAAREPKLGAERP